MSKALSLVWNPPKDVYKRVEEYGYYGFDMRQVCDYYGVSWKAWKEETKRDPNIEQAYRMGKARGALFASKKLFLKMDEGDTKAITFFLERRAKWTTNAPVEETNDREQELVFMPEYVVDPVDAAKLYAETMLKD